MFAFFLKNKISFLKYLLTYLGHPILFLAFLFTVGKGSLGRDSLSFFGIQTFTSVSTNTHKMHLGLYLMITLPIFLVWSIGSVQILSMFSSFKVDTFLRLQTGYWCLLLAAPGLFNLYVWSSDGMEGNIFGFIFGFPMLGAAFGYVGLWLYHVYRAFQPIAS